MSKVSTDRWDIFIAVTYPLLLMLMFSPQNFPASYWADDFTYLAIVQQANSPLELFAYEFPFGGHLYRPIPLIFWWLTEHMMGGGVAAQYLCNSALLGTCGSSMYWLFREFEWKRWSAFLVGLLFVAAPSNVSTSLWLADRFDLVAMPAILIVMICWLRFLKYERNSSLAVGLVFFVIALMSKELGYLLPPLMIVITVLNWRQWKSISSTNSRKYHIAVIAGFALVALLSIAWRNYVGVALSPPSEGHGLLNVALSGYIKWWHAFPAAIAFVRAPSSDVSYWFAVFIVIGGALLVISGWKTSIHNPDKVFINRFAISMGLGILFLVPIIQAPHFHMVNIEFAGPAGGPTGMFAERFYFFGSAGLMILILNSVAVHYQTMNGTLLRAMRFLAISGYVSLISWCLLRDITLTQLWVLKSGWTSRIAQAASLSARSLDITTTPCRLIFLGSGDGVFQFASEAMVKVISADDRLDRCEIRTEVSPMFTLTNTDSLPWNISAKHARTTSKVVTIGKWAIMPGDQYGPAIDGGQTVVFCYRKDTGAFVPNSAALPECR